jgi:chaperone BCS1
MACKGCLLVFRRQYQAGDFSNREEVSIYCFGRYPQILKELVSGCNTKYTNPVRDKANIYEQQDGRWTRSVVMNRRRIDTVVLHESKKGGLLKDIKDFLDETISKMIFQPGHSIPKGLPAVWSPRDWKV